MSTVVDSNSNGQTILPCTMMIRLLPDVALQCIGSFLSPIEKSIFAVTTSTSNLLQNELHAMETLDFEDVSELASRLTEDDLMSILISVDAVNNLKKLVLKNCIKVTGRGLETLRGSIVLQHLDLKITDSPNEVVAICLKAITPIVDNILSRDENVGLLLLKFPIRWEQDKTETFLGLKERYGQFFLQGLQHS